MSYQDYLRRRDNEMADQLGTCTHCRKPVESVFGLRESEACPHCGYMAFRFTDKDVEYYEAWIAWNQVGGILCPHQDKPLPRERDPRFVA